MADSDPISETTPNKRRKLHHYPSRENGWESQEEYGDELTEDDLAQLDTSQATMLPSHKRAEDHFPSSKNTLTGRHGAGSRAVTPPSTFITQSTQALSSPPHVTQPTQPLATNGRAASSTQVQVPQSSSPPPRSPGLSSPGVKTPSAKPAQRGGLLARMMGPAGTNFRPPPGVQARPVARPVSVSDSDDESDPPVHHSNDDQTQGLTSNIRPTNFTTSGERAYAAPSYGKKPTGVVAATPPRPSGRSAPIQGASSTVFGSLMASFRHDAQPKPANRGDMASAYASQNRKPKQQQQQQQQQHSAVQRGPSHAQPASKPRFNTLNDIPDLLLQKGVAAMQAVLGTSYSIDTMYDFLIKSHMNPQDAMDRLTKHEEMQLSAADDADELSSMTPAAKRGQAIHMSQTSKDFSEINRRNAKQEVKAPQRSIAEKYAASQQSRKASEAILGPTEVEVLDDVVQPKRGRLLKKRPASRLSSPTPSPPAEKRPRLKARTVITIDDDEEDDDDDDRSVTITRAPSEELHVETDSFDSRLLKFFNECTVAALADLCAQPEGVVQLVLEQRPFADLDAVRSITNVSETKSGRKSKTRPIGDKIVDDSADMLRGYEAVDELVTECEKLAEPIQQALKAWGGGITSDGELHLMKLDDTHDSGIGTPASSYRGDTDGKSSPRGKFLTQPENMGDFTMKDYQLVGLNWMNLLWSKKLSCILADDMGLGKTCQVISLLAQLQLQKVDGVHLIIVPGSTLENWMREFARFAPSLNVFPYYGSQKERPELRAQIEDSFGTLDAIVTTYDMAAKPDDNKFLRRLGPCICVYDEAHGLRNPNSERYSQLMRIPSDFRILLTGTPLQNNLQELIAILAFIMPKLFEGKREDLDYIFKHKATTKDSEHSALLSADRIARARKMMTPFILRRKKQQVLDLPTKHSRVERCEMTKNQREYYGELESEAQRLFSDQAPAGTTKAKAAKASSNILMALRKAAIQPLLSRRQYTDEKINKIVNELSKHEEFGDNPKDKIKAYLTGEGPQSLKPGDFSLHTFCMEREYLRKFGLKKEPWMDSGKVQRFKELVTEYHKNGDRLLVFSQFTTMMDILEAVLETLDIKFMRLDGSTRMDTRQDMIDQFMGDDSITVFMLSTKAGGAGINLTCANKVIIFDSGFNPQDDIQAENRAHRVGQTREVEVVRLVTKGTIEEQIHALGESKLALDERVAGETGEDKQAEKSGEKMVEKLFKDSMQRKDAGGDAHGSKEDLKEAFKAGLENSGVRVASKQAQF